MSKRCYRHDLPGVDLDELGGLLIVIEGPDSSGRSTQIRLLSRWIEHEGHAVELMGLKRSRLVAAELDEAKQGNVLSPRTMALFYATDFYDQLENRIVPALRAGAVILADRYIYTLMARDQVRGGDPEWLEALYSMALVPDAVYLLDTSSENLVDRSLDSHGRLDYWESGMDLGLERDWYRSFMEYQRGMRSEFNQLADRYGLERIDGDRSILEVHADLKERVGQVLERRLGRSAIPYRR
ncbi:MAG: dTMP kinase [Gemmatimonadota bacterium]